MPRPAKRQHSIARFYLRNFAEPALSDNLCVYDIRKHRWERRTPDGVGWYRHLCSFIDMRGSQRDDFDQFLKLNVEDPAAPIFSKLATGGTIEVTDRRHVALFLALTAFRSSELMNSFMTHHLGELVQTDRAKLDADVRRWCDITGKPYGSKSHFEFKKPGMFEAIWKSVQRIQCQLLQLEWHWVHTTRDRPFVTSDRPVFAHREQDVCFVSFPASSEVALIVITDGKFNEALYRTKEAYMLNRRMMERASEFIVACKESFPADDYLPARALRG